MRLSYIVHREEGEINADSPTELLARLQTEHEFWKNIGPFEIDDLEVHSRTKNSIKSFLPRANAMLNGWVNHINLLENGDYSEFIDQPQLYILSIEKSIDLPPLTSSNTARIIKSLWEQGRTDAALACFLAWDKSDESFLFRVDKDPQSGLGSFAGLGRAILEVGSTFSVPYPNAVNATQNSLDVQTKTGQKLASELGLQIENLRQDLVLLEQQKQNFESSSVARIKKLHRIALNTRKKASKLDADSMAAREEEFEKLKEAFSFQLRIKHPVKLWQKKQARHSTNSDQAWRKFSIGSIILTIALATLVYCAGDFIAASFTKTGCGEDGKSICKGISAKGPLTLTALALWTTVALWYLRLQMKVFLSERHLALDAEERTAFAESYLALLVEGGASIDNEAIILQSLFRPTQDGIIQDETGPDFSAAGLLSKVLTSNPK